MVPIGEDGSAKVEIDTAPAKEIHGDMDAKYTIVARVVDASRGVGLVVADAVAALLTFAEVP